MATIGLHSGRGVATSGLRCVVPWEEVGLRFEGLNGPSSLSLKWSPQFRAGTSLGSIRGLRRRWRKCRPRSCLSEFSGTGDAELGQSVAECADRVATVAWSAVSELQELAVQSGPNQSAAQWLSGRTEASLKAVVGELGSEQLPGQVSEKVIESLDSVQSALGQVSAYPVEDGKAVGLSMDQIQDAFSSLGATAVDKAEPVLQQSLDQVGQSNAGILERAASIWQNLPAPDGLGGAQLFAQSPDSFLEGAKSIGSAFRSSVEESLGLERLALSAVKVLHQTEVLTSDLGASLANGLVHFDLSSVQASADQIGVSARSVVGDIATAMVGSYPVASYPAATALLFATAGTVFVGVSSASGYRAFVEGKDLPLRYDSQAIRAYFRRRPTDVMWRATKIAVQSSALAASILLDFATGKARDNERLRATQLVSLIARLGPTAIKIGQSLSIRPDIVPVVYLEELQKLQDRVPPFPNDEAKRIIQEGLGKPAEDIFQDMSVEPIAAASLGQVYKARLKETGQPVAVKVQRPGVLEGISKDLFILRSTSFMLQKLPIVQSDLVGLLDTWAIRFFDELDYVQEAKNALRFAEDMKELSNVTVPYAYLPYTSRKVLTSAWVQGEKLSESKAADLLPLVTVALNCYLIQLLESGFLHADPHPGNLLRTPDGRLCVLDFGLMTEITEEQRYTLIDYIAHLVNNDFAKVAEDLVKLGFVPPELVDPAKTLAVVPQLSRVLTQLVQGGGARKVNFAQVVVDLAKISEDYVFVIPPYFALILRAFSVLEGIGLEADPDYTIVEECYPYISKRLITDDSPRAREALKYFLYSGKDQLDVQRVEDIAHGFQTFRESMAPWNPSDSLRRSTPLDPTTKQALLLIFDPKGSYIQELLLTELVRSVDALSREAVAALWQYLASRLRLPVPSGRLAPGSWPLAFNRVASLSDEDQRSLDTVRRLWSLLEPQLNLTSSTDMVGVAQHAMPLLRDLLPGVTTTAQRFVIMLLQRQALRLADDLDGRNSVREWNQDPTSFARKVKPLRFL